jgi:hypothetical protein
VNVKLYGKTEGLLDLPVDGGLLADYTLVLAGPRGAAVPSRGTTRPIVISSVFLFENPELLTALRQRGVKIGVATSVARSFWDSAEIYPQNDARFPLDAQQRHWLALFAPEA